MSGTAASLGVRPEAVNAFLALADALNRMTDDGRRPVCEQRPAQWSSDVSPPARQDAAAACGFCPAQPACLAFAIAQREPAGVWGGRDLTPNQHGPQGESRMRSVEAVAWLDCAAGCGAGMAVDARHVANLTARGGWYCSLHEGHDE